MVQLAPAFMDELLDVENSAIRRKDPNAFFRRHSHHIGLEAERIGFRLVERLSELAPCA